VLLKRIDYWSLTSLQQCLVKTGGRLMKHARYYWPLLAVPHDPAAVRRDGGGINALPVPTGRRRRQVAKFGDHGMRGGAAVEFGEKKGFSILDFLGRAKLLLSKEDHSREEKAQLGGSKSGGLGVWGYLVATKFKLWSSLLTCRPLTPCPLPCFVWGHS